MPGTYISPAETGFYATGTRYYDPEISRFINADTTDVLAVSPMALTDKNLYAYCDNNPVVRIDVAGNVWETVFDIASLALSLGEVVTRPTDPWAWAGLVGDVPPVSHHEVIQVFNNNVANLKKLLFTMIENIPAEKVLFLRMLF